MTSCRALLLSALSCFLSIPALAQTPVSGHVTDAVGGPVVNATVTLTGSGVPSPPSVATGPDGAFRLATVDAGAYVVTVDAPGFQRWSRSIDTTVSTEPLEVVLPVPGFSEAVAVTARRLEEDLPQDIERTGVRVQTITGQQIENGGYYDVGQALQALVPGLFLMPRSGPFDYVDASLQGSRTNEVLWLIDGVRISNRLYNGTTPLDTIPAHMIERIEVLEGGQGLFYGTQAVAGAVNVVTKSFSDTTNGRVQSGFDSNQGRHVNLFARDSFGGHKFVVYGSADKATGYQNFPAAQYQPSATDRRRSYDVLMLGGKYAYDFSRALRLSAGYQRSDVTLDNLRPGRSGAAHVGGLAAGYNTRAEHVLSAKIDYDIRQNARLFFKAYYHRWDTDFTEIRNVAESPGTRRVSSDAAFWGFKDYGGNVLAKLTPHRGLEYFAGYDFQNYRGRDEVLLIAPNTESVHALFAQVRTTRDLFQKATLAVGARFNAPANAQRASVWNVSSRFELTPRVFARGTVGTAFRYPDAYELFAIDPDCCFGNPNLKPERSTNVNGSFGYRASIGKADVTLEAIAFYRRVTDIIVDVADAGPGGNTMTDNRPDVVRVRGLSFVASAPLTPALSSSASYTHNHSQQTNELAGGYSALAGIPSKQFNASLDFHPTREPFGATLTINHVGPLTNTVPVFGAVAAGNFTIVDLSGRVFLDSRRRHRLSLRLENIFDEVYTTRHSRNFLDASPTPFLVSALGMPRTVHVSYSVGL